MSLLRASSLSFCYPSAAFNVFSDIDFDMSPGAHVGLIGGNGCGKSTLLKIICGELTDFSGELYVKKTLNITALPQEVVFTGDETVFNYVLSVSAEIYQMYYAIKSLENSGSENVSDGQRLAQLYTEYAQADGYTLEGAVEKVAAGLGLSNMLQRPVKTLSGGEKTKASLLRLLVSKPDMLILDEPTNHLDVQTLEWLENYLKKSKLAYIAVSHDRKFLDNCCDRIWELKNGKLSEYSGNYSFFKQQKEETLARQIENSEQLAKKLTGLQTAAARVRNDADSMEKFKAKRSVSKSGRICKRDSGSEHGVRTTNRQKAATVLENRVERMSQKFIEEKPFIEKKRSISFEPCKLRNDVVLRIEDLSKAFGVQRLFEHFDHIIENGDRVAISGANGTGKSTLLKMIMGLEKADSGNIVWAPSASVGYYAQELECLDSSSTILDAVIDGDLEKQTQARTILGCLKLEKDKVNRLIGTLSSGEKSKTLLAKLLFDNPDVLVLDEPTNHLEIEAREALEDALQDYTGTLIFVSHDRYFSEKLRTKEISL